MKLALNACTLADVAAACTLLENQTNRGWTLGLECIAGRVAGRFE